MLKHLRNLPRDGRDTLFLLAVIAWVVVPQIERLPLWCSALTGGVLVWRGVLAWQGRPLPSRWWLLVLAMLTLAATLWTHRTVLGRDAGVTLIVALLALKTLELRAKRDAFVVFFLSFFTMLTNFFFSQSLLTAAAMLLALLGLLTALVNAHMPVGKPPLLHAARMAASMALLGAPIMAVLFLLFPRMAPLWGIPSDAMAGRSGLSSSMQVGTIASLALDDRIAMRIRFEGTPPRQSDLYFRGPVLSTFDGREWRVSSANLAPRQRARADLQLLGPPVRYEVTLEPNNRPWLLLLEAAGQKPELTGFESFMTSDLQWLTDRPVTDLVRYRAQSHPLFRHGPMNAGPSLQEFVALPRGSNPRTVALATQLRNDPALANAPSSALVRAVLERLRTGGYTYTLDPGVYGQHTADEFWFDRKEGFCEHIASSFVILMRALNIPARVVTGYQGGELNAVDNFWVVRQSDAHAWAEVWMPNQGWVRVDPTGAVAPGRTGSLQRLVAPQGAMAAVLNSVSPAMALNLRAMWEAVNNGWNQWILNYTQSKQLNLLRDIGFESPSWEDLSYVLIGIIVLVSLCGAAWTLWERHRQDPWLRLLHAASQRLAKIGVPSHPGTPPRQLAQALLRMRPGGDAGTPTEQTRRIDAIRQWLLRLEVYRYAPGGGDRGGLATLQREFKLLDWPT